ncbi:hypothetical protein ZWY2020_025727 [Hordeum vulgare]|nr:hypothetical protein ZWY2020_025727 [Hordeum vulgare]
MHVERHRAVAVSAGVNVKGHTMRLELRFFVAAYPPPTTAVVALVAVVSKAAIETDSQELELDLSSLNTVNTMFATIFSKLGRPIKTTVSGTILEEALNGSIVVSDHLGNSCKKVGN